AMVNGDTFSQLTRKHGIKIAAGFPCSVEDIGLAVGEVVGHGSVKSAARMNGAVVIFLDQVEKVNRVVEAGLTVNEMFVQVLPLTQPATHRRHLYMILNNRNVELNLRFHVKIDDYEYVIFASSSAMKCFGCGEEGHTVGACPRRGDPTPPGGAAAGDPPAVVVNEGVLVGERGALGEVAQGEDGGEGKEKGEGGVSVEQESGAREAQLGGGLNGGVEQAEEVKMVEEEAGEQKAATKRRKKRQDTGSEAKASKVGEEEEAMGGQGPSEGSESEGCVSDSSDSHSACLTHSQREKLYSAEQIKMFLQKVKNRRNLKIEEFFQTCSARLRMSQREESGFTDQEGFRLKKLVLKAKRAIDDHEKSPN
uniref:CCHC-type domain-containing protein n=1 Tax=Gasterosteus aculeatus TaxID=69293 RepID=G3Q7R1_GASAC